MINHQHLYKYPHLIRLCKEEQIPIVKYLPISRPLVLSDIVATNVPNKLKLVYEARKKQLDICLGFAYKYEILNKKERVSRLIGDDPSNFWSTVSELMIGLWLDKQNVDIREIEPVASNGRKGDYLVEKMGNIVFIEIKTPFGEKNFLNQNQMIRDLIPFFKQKKLPVKSFILRNYPLKYDYTNEKQTTFRNIELFISNYLPLLSEKTVTYVEKNGINVDIELVPGVSYPAIYGFVTWSGIKEFLKDRLSQDKVQVSTQDIPSVCVINDFNANIDNEAIECVLYGTDVEDRTQIPSIFYREDDGIWSRKRTSKLSAVCILKFKPYVGAIKTMSAYFCPNPKQKFSRDIFSDKNIRWWALDKNNQDIVQV